MAVFRFHCGEIRASRRFSAGEVSTLPTVGVASSMNEMTPCNMEATDQAGTCRGGVDVRRGEAKVGPQQDGRARAHPSLRVKVAHGEAQARVRVESSTAMARQTAQCSHAARGPGTPRGHRATGAAALRSEHHDRWRLVGVLAREDELAVVLPILKGRVRRARDHEVPFKDVAGSAGNKGVRREEPRTRVGSGERSLGLGHDVRHWLLAEPLVLLLQPGQARL